ncbi:MAG: glutathione peroxidase [Planctomycetaceae bacterium]
MIIRVSLTLLFCISFIGCAEDPAEEITSTDTAAAAAETEADSHSATDHSSDHAGTETSHTGEGPMSGPLRFEMETLAGEKVALSKYKGNVVLMVNVASECGLTPQYEQLQALHKKYADKGLSVVAFPCNQFGGQEPGSADEIQEFCSTKYGVEFDMMAKVDVNGDGACDLYKHLTSLETQPQGSGDIGWNFEKFLVDRAGNVINRFSPRMTPEDAGVVAAIETALAATP